MYINPEINDGQVYVPKTPDEWAEQALLQTHSAPAKPIAEMELLRGVEFRPGRAEINLFRSKNCEAALAYSRGEVMEGMNACIPRRRRRGPFVKCVVAKGHMKGSCSNCHYHDEGSRCNFRFDSGK
jgi:hypothetical protein